MMMLHWLASMLQLPDLPERSVVWLRVMVQRSYSPVAISILMLQAGSDAHLKEKLKKVLRLMTTTISTAMTVL
jgi:hypothetical protein